MKILSSPTLPEGRLHGAGRERDNSMTRTAPRRKRHEGVMICSSGVATVQPMRRHFLFLLLAIVILAAPTLTEAITIFPIDRAAILAGARFDVKVEFDRVIAPG